MNILKSHHLYSLMKESGYLPVEFLFLITSATTSAPIPANTAEVTSGVNLSKNQPTTVKPVSDASPKYLRLCSVMWVSSLRMDIRIAVYFVSDSSSESQNGQQKLQSF